MEQDETFASLSPTPFKESMLKEGGGGFNEFIKTDSLEIGGTPYSSEDSKGES